MWALAIGKFDALHRGHRALAQRAAVLGAPALLTFPGMAEVLGWSPRVPLVAASDRNRVLTDWSADPGKPLRTVEIPFADIRALDPAAFIDYVRQVVPVSALIVGEDFRFGKGRMGDVTMLRTLAAAAGLTIAVIPPVISDGAPVSSSRIRHALEQGDVVEASRLLGRPHRLVGTVVRGDGRGAKLGFPTANCGACENLVPAPGVYASWAWLDGKRISAAVNIGRLPTIGADRPLTVEAHLLDWQGACYGATLGLDLVTRLRDEQRFPSLDALRGQLVADVAATRQQLLG